MIRTELESSTKYHHKLLNRIFYWFAFGLFTILEILCIYFSFEIILIASIAVIWVITILLVNDSFYFVEYDEDKIWYGNIGGIRGEIRWDDIDHIKTIKRTNYLGLCDAEGNVKVKIAKLVALSGVFDELFSRNQKLFDLDTDTVQITPVIQFGSVIVAAGMFFGVYLGFTDLGVLYGIIALLIGLFMVGTNGGIVLEDGGIRVNIIIRRMFIPWKDIINFGTDRQYISYYFVAFWRKGKVAQQNLFQNSSHLNLALYYLKNWWITKNDFTVEYIEEEAKKVGFISVQTQLSGEIRQSNQRIAKYALSVPNNVSGQIPVNLLFCNNQIKSISGNEGFQVVMNDVSDPHQFELKTHLEYSGEIRDEIKRIIPDYLKLILANDLRIIRTLNLKRVE